MANQIIGHIEIPASDLERASVFYNNVFDWDLKAFGKGYLLHNTKAGMTVGVRKVEKVNSGDTTIFHINVSDIEQIVEKVKSFGGRIAREKTVIPVYGWYALINDTEGNVLGLYQAH